MRRIPKSKKGVAVIMAMWLLAVLAIIGTTFAFMMRLEPIIARHHRDEVSAVNVAQAGLDKAYDLLKAGQAILKLEENLTDTAGEAVVGTYEVNVGGVFFFTFAGANTKTFYCYHAYKNEWETMKYAPGGISSGGALAWGGGGYVYGLRGGTTTDFYRYKLSTDTWKKMRDINEVVDWGGALAHWYEKPAGEEEYDHYLYATIGNSTTGFYFYDIDNDSWTAKANTPGSVGRGGALAWAGDDYIYALQGGSTKGFWRYSISNNTWEKYHCPECGYTSPTSGTCPTVGCPNYGEALVMFIPDTPGTVSFGGALAYTGGDYIYATKGGSTTTFWRYKISTNTWNPDPGDSPEITGGIPAVAPETIGTGGSLVWSGRDYIYALRGSVNKTFWRYKISTDTWNPDPGDSPEISGGVPATTPGTIAAGGSLTRSGDLYWIDSMGYVPDKTNPRAKKKIEAIVDTSATAIVDNRIIYWKEIPED